MRSNYSREEDQKIVEEYIQSGKSQIVFASDYGIKPNTLSAWVTKLKKALHMKCLFYYCILRCLVTSYIIIEPAQATLKEDA